VNITVTSTSTNSVSIILSASKTYTETRFFSITEPPSRSVSQNRSSSIAASDSRSETNNSTATGSRTKRSATPSQTDTHSPTITVDPCNTTFRANSTDFLAGISVGSDVQAFSRPDINGVYILTMTRVQFTLLDSFDVDVLFNTMLRNFYYEVGEQWFVQPTAKGCRVTSVTLLNATSLRYRVQYDSNYALQLSVHDDVVCNVTFNTDIFQCQMLTNQTFNFSLAILAASVEPWVSGVALQAMSSIATALTAALGPVSQLSQSRTSAFMTLSSCQFSIVDQIAFPDNFFQLAVGTKENRYYRGTVIGNLLFLCAMGVLGATAVSAHCYWQRRRNKTRASSPTPEIDRVAAPWEWIDSAAVLRFPSVLLIPVTITFDNTATASVSLIVHPREAYDFGLGVFGVSVCLVILVLVAVAVWMSERLVLRATRVADALPIFQRHSRLRKWLYPRKAWVSRRGADGTSSWTFKSMTSHIFDDLLYPMVTLLELATSLIVGAALGVGLSERRVCVALSILCVVPLVVTCTFLITKQPILTRANFLGVLVTNACALVAAVFIVGGMVASSDALGSVPSIFAFLGIPVMILRSFADYVVLWFRWRYACEVFGCCRGTKKVITAAFVESERDDDEISNDTTPDTLAADLGPMLLPPMREDMVKPPLFTTFAINRAFSAKNDRPELVELSWLDLDIPLACDSSSDAMAHIDNENVFDVDPVHAAAQHAALRAELHTSRSTFALSTRRGRRRGLSVAASPTKLENISLFTETSPHAAGNVLWEEKVISLRVMPSNQDD
jgi:hypothetical protein